MPKRQPRTEPYTAWNVELPESLTSKVELLLLDPTTGRIRYAARQRLTEQLLRQWLTRQQELFAAGEQTEVSLEGD